MDQRRVLDFLGSLGKLKRGESGQSFVRVAGDIPPADLKEIEIAIKNGCEAIDRNGW